MREIVSAGLLRSAHVLLNALGAPKAPKGFSRVRAVSGPNKGRYICMPDLTRLSYLTGTYEPELIKEMTSPTTGGAAYVVGAHVGYHAMALANVATEVFAFEVDPTTLTALRWNIETNDIRNVRVVEKAVSTTDEGLVFASFEYSLVSQVLTEGFTPTEDAKLLRVPSVTIDAHVAEGNSPPRLIKSSITAGEIDVVQGAQKTLKSHRPIVITIAKANVRGELTAFMNAVGYDCRAIEESAMTFERDGVGELLCTPR
jgi:FkbM family methyltransferase